MDTPHHITDRSSWAGCRAPEAVRRLVLALPEVRSITLASYNHLPILQQRLEPSPEEQEAIKEALRLRSDLGLPFWDAVMLTAPRFPRAMSRLFTAASTHVSLRGSDKALSREEVIAGRLTTLLGEEDAAGSELSIVSEVTLLTGEARHLALMDFHARPSAENRTVALEVCRRIFDGPAVLLESGGSYHAYGLSLLPTDGLNAFLGRALLFAPIIDRAYIAHQLIEQRCALRISSGRSAKTATSPIVVAWT